MELMGALQPGLPTPAAFLKITYKIIIDLKDCFIPLHFMETLGSGLGLCRKATMRLDD